MAFSDILRGIADLILNNKLITFLSVALFAFIIATIALAGQNNSNADALAACQEKLSHATSTPPAVTTPTPVDTTTVPSADTTTVPSADTTTVASADTTTASSIAENVLKLLPNEDYREQIRRR